jgi:hypothetical protein
MAVWDLNSNLDVFSMQTFLRGLIYVRGAIQAHLPFNEQHSDTTCRQVGLF